MDAYKKVRAGERVQIAARAWNRVIDEVVTRPNFGGSQSAPPPTNFIVRCRNSSDEVVGRWGVLMVTGVLEVPSGATGAGNSSFEQWPGVIGVAPATGSTGPFVIATEPIKPGEIGLAAIDGVVQCKLDVAARSHGFATFLPGSTTKLKTAESGNAEILWKGQPAGTTAWGLVRLGSSGKGSRYFRLTEPLNPCFSATGDEVKIVNLDCLDFAPVDGGMQNIEVFDVSNAVRVFNLVHQHEIDTPAPVGTVVEAVRESKYATGSGADESFWRILQILSCDCGSSTSSHSHSSYSHSSHSHSSSSSYSHSSSASHSHSSGSTSHPGGSSSSGGSHLPPCQDIDVVTDVTCVDGSLQVTKQTICAIVVA